MPVLLVLLYRPFSFYLHVVTMKIMRMELMQTIFCLFFFFKLNLLAIEIGIIMN